MLSPMHATFWAAIGSEQNAINNTARKSAWGFISMPASTWARSRQHSRETKWVAAWRWSFLWRGRLALACRGHLARDSRAGCPRHERARPRWPRHLRPSPRSAALTLPAGTVPQNLHRHIGCRQARRVLHFRGEQGMILGFRVCRADVFAFSEFGFRVDRSMQEIEIRVPGVAERRYRIVIGSGILPAVWPQIKAAYGKCGKFVITDENLVAAGHLDALLGGRHGPYFAIQPAGEGSKRIDTAVAIVEAMEKAYLGRDTVAVALGGGTVGDIAGFAAAIFQRGLPVVQVPTTTLAQADPAIG